MRRTCDGLRALRDGASAMGGGQTFGVHPPMAHVLKKTAAVAVAAYLSVCPVAAVAQQSPMNDAAQSVSEASATNAHTPPPQDGALRSSPQDGASRVLPHDLTPMGMFLAASPVVQAVMVGLGAASIATWTVGLAKWWELRTARRRLRQAFAAIEQAHGLAHAAETAGFIQGAAGEMLRAALTEARQSAGLPGEGLKERAASRLERIEAAAARRMSAGMGVLASVGSVGPFVGLFGTVWGVMVSFIGISRAQTTNLAVVAPGIAEALLATAIGLVAAIPAVLLYNMFSRAIGGYRGLLGDVSAAALRHVSRDYDRGVLPRVQRAAAE